MTSATSKAFRACLYLLASTVLAVSAAAQDQPQEAHATTPKSKGSFSKSETITGTLTAVDPIKGLIVVTCRGPHEAPSLQLSWSESASSDPEHPAHRSPITLSRGPGQTDYDFKVTSSTSIDVNGVQQPLTALARYTNANTKVRFTARRDGDFALEIAVSH